MDIPETKESKLTSKEDSLTGDVSVEGTSRRKIIYLFQPRVTSLDGTVTYLKPIELAVGFGKGRREARAELPIKYDALIAENKRPKSEDRDLPWNGEPGGVGEFDAPDLKADELIVPLPGLISNVVAGGGGQFLIIHLEREQQLAIFDTSLAKIAGYIALDESDVLYAAGMDDILIAFNDTKIIQRWDLKTRKRKLSRSYPFKGLIKTMSMGPGSNGPLLIVRSEGTEPLSQLSYEFFHPRKMRKIDFEFVGRPNNNSFRDRIQLRPSMDGTVFGSWATSHSPTGIDTIIISGKKVQFRHAHISTAFVLPSATGLRIYSSFGIHSPNYLDPKRRSNPSSSSIKVMPSLDGPYDFGAQLSHRFSRSEKTTKSVSIHLAGDPEPLVNIPDVRLPKGADRSSNFLIDQQIWLIGKANMLVVTESGADELYIRKIDIEELLQESETDFLFVTSQPPLTAKSGKALDYQVKAESKQGGVSFKLESGPHGMSISDAGLLSWMVPKNDSGKTVSIIISVTDETEQQKFHTFKLKIE